MATSFKIKAVAELRAAKKIARQQEATAQAEYEENKAAKLLANEKRRADKMVRISQPEPTTAPVVEEVVEETVEEVVEQPKAKAKPKITVKKKGRPAKAKK
jgi:uncharacterized Fe-S cluster-containing radical SAM superfamily protein|tara:strand:+ start:942 stop:1244 length:303 start_codon:yes stop_codon:yes gene_type:complete